MRRILLGLALLVGVSVLAVPAWAGDCTCAKASEAGQGWCEPCKHGMVYGFEIASHKLYDLLTGTTFDAAKSKCKGCQDAAKTHGTCDHCKVSIAHGHMFACPAAYTLAKGEVTTQEPIKAKVAACKDCAKNAKATGFCTACNVGMVGGRAYKTKEAFDAATKAHAQLAKAVAKAKACEGCAVALASDTACEKCKVTYKNGEPTKA